jgi:hypothetical protein
MKTWILVALVICLVVVGIAVVLIRQQQADPDLALDNGAAKAVGKHENAAQPEASVSRPEPSSLPEKAAGPGPAREKPEPAPTEAPDKALLVTGMATDEQGVAVAGIRVLCIPVPNERVRRTVSSALRELAKEGRPNLPGAVTDGEGRFRLSPPDVPTRPLTVTCKEENGTLTTDAEKAVYLVHPTDLIDGKVFKVGGKEIRPKPDFGQLLRSFKATGDPARVHAAEIPLTR